MKKENTKVQNLTTISKAITGLKAQILDCNDFDESIMDRVEHVEDMTEENIRDVATLDDMLATIAARLDVLEDKINGDVIVKPAEAKMDSNISIILTITDSEGTRFSTEASTTTHFQIMEKEEIDEHVLKQLKLQTGYLIADSFDFLASVKSMEKDEVIHALEGGDIFIEKFEPDFEPIL